MNLNLPSYIDHTCLRPDAGKDVIKELCREAVEYKFKAVCINPVFVWLAAQELKGSGVSVCTVIGFPLGASTISVKSFEAQQAVQDGADEIDMVINIAALKAGEDKYLLEEIHEVVRKSKNALVKVIIETCLLNEREKERICKIAVKGGAHFVKTSTGFSFAGATIEDVALMRKVVGNKIGVKASGGIRDKKTLLAMIAAGATRIGTSRGPQILGEAKN
ncbi:MAG: deoxyribose-phosphate aldolase [Bacillota bacterium]|jgi:deoxyribose-phosphate aldolase